MIDWSAVEFVECAPRPVELKVKPFVSCAQIKARVAKRYGITIADMDGHSRKRQYAWPRQIAMALCYRRLKPYGYSLPLIAKNFGGRHHTTTLYACRKFRKGTDGISGPKNIQRSALDARAAA